MWFEGTLYYKDSSHILYSRVTYWTKCIKNFGKEGRNWGLPFPTECTMLAMWRALISFSSFWPTTSTSLSSSLNYFWNAEEDTFCSFQILLIFSDQKSCPGCPVMASCMGWTQPGHFCFMKSSSETVGENYMKEAISYLRKHPSGWIIVTISEYSP